MVLEGGCSRAYMGGWSTIVTCADFCVVDVVYSQLEQQDMVRADMYMYNNEALSRTM